MHARFFLANTVFKKTLTNPNIVIPLVLSADIATQTAYLLLTDPTLKAIRNKNKKIELQQPITKSPFTSGLG